MDYIKQFEIELDKEVYYAGETLSGCVLVQNTENIKVQGKFFFVNNNFIETIVFPYNYFSLPGK